MSDAPTDRTRAAAALPPAARRMLAAVTVAALGTGLVLPFTLILLHEVRGFTLPTTGLLLAVPGVIGLAGVPAAGALVDRIGASTVLRGVLALQTVASLLLATVTTVPLVAVAMVLQGLGMGPAFIVANTLLAGLVRDADRQSRAFAISFTLNNAGIGVASLAAGLVADVHRAGSFEVLFVGNAVLTAVAAMFVPSTTATLVPVDGATASDDAVSYREVLRDRAFRVLVLVALLLAVVGYSAVDSGLPAFGRVVLHVSPAAIAASFTANTALIVAGQLLVVRLIAGHRRSLALAGAAAVWTVSWALLGGLAFLPGGPARAVGVLVFGGLFGLGETLMAPCLSPLVNALASDRMRGRYNAVSGTSFSIAFVVSPAVSGLLIGLGLAAVWVSLLVIVSVITALVSATVLRARVSDQQDGLLVERTFDTVAG